MKKFGLLILFFFSSLMFAQSTIYFHNFGTTTITTHPYTVAPLTFDPNLTNSSWSNSTNAWTSFSGNGGAPSQAIALNNSSGTPTITITFNVNNGYELSIDQFNFWRQRSNAGAQNWSMSINGIQVGSGTNPTAGAFIGATSVANTISNLTGTISIIISLSGATGTGTFRIDDFELIGSVTPIAALPLINLSPSSISGFTYVEGSGPSAEQFFTISGSNLTDDISIIPPANYEISTGTVGSFVATNPITLTQSGGTVASTTIYVRLAAGLSAGTYNSQLITASSTGATNLTVTCNGVVTLPLPAAFINEIHYDNNGADVNEFVEVLIPISYTTPTELAKFNVILYNGSGGVVYDTKNLSVFTEGATEDGYTFYYYTYPTNGIQNGAQDGVALSYDTSLLQFLSYEGPFTATEGIANGVLATDVGVSESGTEVGMSIGLRTDLPVWALLIAQTPGQINALVFPVELTSFSATTIGKDVKLSWNTATEVNNYGFEVERSVVKGEWDKIGFVNGNGNSNSPKSYSFVDDKVNAGKSSYRLKQIDNDGQFEYSKVIEIDVNGTKKFELTQNYPNPFNPTTTIQFQLPVTGLVKLTLYNILGQEIKTLVNEVKDAGTHTVNFDASDLNSGVYVYKIESGSFTQTRKMTLVK